MKIIKIVLKIVLALLILLIAAAVIIPMVVDVNSFKPQIEALAKKQIGRDVKFNGPIKLNIFPWAGLSITDVTVANAPGFQPDNMAAIAELSTRVKLLPLLQKKVEIGETLVDGLELYYTVNADGVSNIQDILDHVSANAKPTSVPAPAAESEPVTVAEDLQIAIHKVTVKNSAVHYDDQHNGVNLALQPFFELDMAGANPTATIESVLKFADTAKGVDVSVDVRTKLTLIDNVIKVEKLDVASDVKMNEMSVNATLAGAIDIPLLVDLPNKVFEVKAVDVLSLNGKANVNNGAMTADATIDMALNALMETINNIPTPKSVDLSKLKAVVNLNNNGQAMAADIDLASKADIAGGVADVSSLAGVIKASANGFTVDSKLDGKLSADIKKKLITIAPLNLYANIENQAQKLVSSATVNVSGVIEPTYISLSTLAANADTALNDIKLNTVLNSAIDMKVSDNTINIKKLTVNNKVAIPDMPEQAVNLETNGYVNIKTMSFELPRLAVSAAGVNVTGNAKGADILNERNITSNINVAQFNPKTLLNNIGKGDVIKGFSAEALNKATVNATVAMKGDVITAQAKAVVDDITAQLNSTANIGQPRPHIAVNADISKVLLTRYLPASTAPAPANAQNTATADNVSIMDKELPIKMITDMGFDLDAVLKIAGVTYNNIQTGAITAKGALTKGSAKITDTVKIFNGDVIADINIAEQNSAFTSSGKVNIKGLDMDTVIKTFANKSDMLSGAFDADADIAMDGITLRSMLGSMDGKLTYTLRKPVIHNFAYNPDTFKDDLKNFSLVGKGKQTALADVKGSATITDGNISLQRINMSSSAASMTGDIGGTVNIAKQELKLDGKFDIDKITVPYTVTGGFKSIKVDVDEAALVKSVVQKAAEDAIRGAIQDKLGTGASDGKTTEQLLQEKAEQEIRRGLQNLFK